MIQFNVPQNVEKILNILHEAGEEAYIVGGCVRDLLLGVEPADWDITTSALPERVKNLFQRTIDTGLEHGTVTVMIDKEGYEITTYRIDGKYEDHRRPKDVVFTRNLQEDLLRRDFTINAMAYNSNQGIQDFYNGMEDLEAGIIRCVGNPTDRFTEDALRMLRAIRFSAKLGFVIESETYDSIVKLAPLIEHVSAERIYVELTKTLVSKEPEKIKYMGDTKLIDYIIPEFKAVIGLEQNNPYHRFHVDDHIYEALRFVEPLPALRWAMYLHDIGKGYTRTTDDKGIDHFYGHPAVSEELSVKILKRLKTDNKTITRVSRLVRYHDERFPNKKKTIRKKINQIGEDYFEDFFQIRRADIKAQHLDHVQLHMSHLDELIKLYHEILLAKDCLSIKDLAVNGHDLMLVGVENGKDIGRILNKLLTIVLEDPELNTKETLLKEAKELQLGE